MTTQVPDYITVEELPKYQQQNNIVLLDIRDERSFQQHHLPNAVLIQPNEIAYKLDDMDTDKHYIIVCYHGILAVSVMNFMRQYGLKVSVLKDGMAAVSRLQ